MVGHRLPAVVVDGAGPEHLEVLGTVTAGSALPAPTEHVGEAGTVEMRLLDAVDRLGQSDAGPLEHCGQHVDGVGVLPPQADGATTGGKAHDARVGDATLVDLALPTLEW